MVEISVVDVVDGKEVCDELLKPTDDVVVYKRIEIFYFFVHKIFVPLMSFQKLHLSSTFA